MSCNGRMRHAGLYKGPREGFCASRRPGTSAQTLKAIRGVYDDHPAAACGGFYCLRPAHSQPGQVASADDLFFDPPGIIHSIYTRVAAGDGESGGNFVIQGKAARAKYLSKSLIALWAKSDARTPDGDVGAIDFDPVTNSQAPSVKSFTVTPEKLDSGTATIAVKMIRGYEKPNANPADAVVRYDFVRDGGHWKVDDIRGANDGKPWSSAPC